MGLETGTYINSLVATNPVGATDPKSQGDDHIRLLKSTILATFPALTGAVTSSHTELNILDGATLSTAELNYVDGVTSAIQTQLDAKLATSGLLTAILAVDGAGSGIDADLLDGESSAAFHAAANITGSHTLPDGVLSTNVPLLNAANVFTGGAQWISNTLPQLLFQETDVAADNKLWDFVVNSGSLFGRAPNDALSSAGNWLVVNRSGVTINSIALAATAITLNGVAVSDYPRLSQSNTFAASQNFFGTGAQNEYAAAPTIGAAKAGAVYIVARDETNDIEAILGADNGASGVILGAVSNHQVALRTNNTAKLTIGTDGTITTLNTSSAEAGYKGLPQNSQSTDYAAALGDASKVLHQTGASKTFTIPANGSVAYPVGTALTFSVANATGVTIAITTDTLRLAGVGTTGSRTLAQYGVATAVKIAATEWYISGAGLT